VNNQHPPGQPFHWKAIISFPFYYFLADAVEQHSSVISHLLSQVRLGMDLTKVRKYFIKWILWNIEKMKKWKNENLKNNLLHNLPRLENLLSRKVNFMEYWRNEKKNEHFKNNLLHNLERV
jgi:hypothetical protein